MAERYGLQMHTAFNMTETAVPIRSRRESRRNSARAAGHAPASKRVSSTRNDIEVPHGDGRRADPAHEPPVGNHAGLLPNPQATADVWRNGWFHTGDAFRRDAEGNFFFVDRMKDAIRRRGENISSFEVEAEALVPPGRARGGRGPGAERRESEDEVMLVVTLQRRCHAGSARAAALPRAAHGALHVAALRARRRRNAEDARRPRSKSIGCAPKA